MTLAVMGKFFLYCDEYTSDIANVIGIMSFLILDILGNDIRITSYFFFFSSRRRHTRCSRDWSSDVCSSDLAIPRLFEERGDSDGATAGGVASWRSEQSPKPLSSRGQLGPTPRREKMGLYGRHRRRAGRQHLGHRSLRRSRFARHQLRRLSTRSHS